LRFIVRHFESFVLLHNHVAAAWIGLKTSL